MKAEFVLIPNIDGSYVKRYVPRADDIVGELVDLIVCEQCDWSGTEDDLADLFCPSCGNYIEYD